VAHFCRRLADYLLTPITWVIVAFATVVSCLYVIITTRFVPRKWGRTYLLYAAYLWANMMLWATLSHVRITYVSRNQKHPRIFMSNHASLSDIPVLMLALPLGFRFMSKKEVFRVPIMGFVMKMLGYISIDRENRRAALNSLDKAAQILHDEHTSVWISPEGTRTVTGELGPFKKGPFYLALQARVPLVPIWLSGTFDLLPKGKLIVRARTKIDILVGPDFTDHLNQELTPEELSERARSAILVLKSQYESVKPKLPSFPFFGTRRIWLDQLT
jgi:1-acyl-sn-glycerol-3-phosphate acyltransferase